MRYKSQGIIPKGFPIKTPVSSRHFSNIVQHASKALLVDRIHFHWHNKASQLQKIQQLENFLKSSVSNFNQQHIFTAVESSFRNIFNKQKEFDIHKLFLFNNQQNKALCTPASDSRKLILNLSCVLTDSEEAFLMQGLNFLVTTSHSNMDMTCAVESVFSKLRQTLGMEFRWKVKSMLGKRMKLRNEEFL
jgi:hypothetical protein